MLKSIKSALSLLCKRNWREFYVRLLIYLGKLDFKMITLNALNLSPEYCHSYSDSGRENLQKILTLLNVEKNDSVIDFGSGKGGALITLADYPFSKITGVEISKELADIARKNLSRLKITNVEVFCVDARDFIEIDDYNYIYFFNPFPCSVMRIVMKNIASSLAKRKRMITIIYLNPECHNVIIENGIFTKEKEFKCSNFMFYIYNNLK